MRRLCSSLNGAWEDILPACLLRRWLILGVEEPFPRGRKSAAPFTVRKFSLMLQREGERQRQNELLLKGQGEKIKGAGKVLGCHSLSSCLRKTKLNQRLLSQANWNLTSCLSERPTILQIMEWPQQIVNPQWGLRSPMLYYNYGSSMHMPSKPPKLFTWEANSPLSFTFSAPFGLHPPNSADTL